MPKRPKRKNESDSLKGWQQIAAVLGQAVSVAQGWTDSGMPVERRGRYVYSSREDLTRWLGREAAEPVQIATETGDLSAESQARAFVCQKAQHGPQAEVV